MNVENVIFYNHYGNGDLWVSREFILNLMLSIPAKNFYYAHAKDHHLFFDIPNLKYAKLDDNCMMREPYVLYGNTLYINTWIGYAYGKYVNPGVSITLNNYKRMFNDTLSSLKMNIGFYLSDKDYVPNPDFSYLNELYYENINKFMYNHVKDSIILICNGNVYSNQSDNFSFTPYIESIALLFPEIKFILTEKTPLNLDNIFYTEDIIKKSDGSDLPEISYLSTYVDAIIGRSSGPYVFSQCLRNYNNPDLAYLSFTYQEECAHMISQKDSRAKLFWCGSNEHETVLKYFNEISRWSLHE